MRLTALRQWWRDAEPDDKRALARAVKSSVDALRHVVHGQRAASADLAGKIEAATGIGRGELCDACRRCPHWAKGEG